MKNKRDWATIWTSVSALATGGAVIAAIWIGYNANRIAEESKNISNNAFSSLENFNNLQLKMNIIHFNKTMYDLFENEKMNYCKEIINSYLILFYLMSDKTNKEMHDISKLSFSSNISNSILFQEYKITDDDEIIVIKKFLEQFYNNKKSKEFNFSCARDALIYFANSTSLYGEFLTFLGLQGQEWENQMTQKINDKDELTLSCLSHSLIFTSDELSTKYPIYLKKEKQRRQELIERRTRVQNQIQGAIKDLNKSNESKEILNYLYSYLEFIKNNDKKGQKLHASKGSNR